MKLLFFFKYGLRNQNPVKSDRLKEYKLVWLTVGMRAALN
jgi:hypothetical protein